MQDLSTIWGSIASKIANAVGEKLSTQLGQSAKRMQPAGKLAKQSLGAFAKILQPHNPDPLASIQGMFQQIMQGLRGSGKSAKSHLAQDGQSLFGGGKQSDFWTHFFPPRVPKLTGGGQPGNAQASPPSADNGSSPQSSLPTINQFFSWMTGRTGQRVEHLKEKAQSRLDAAAKHRESFGKTIGTADYDEKAHKVAIKAEKAATERLAQATTLEGRATLTGAGASSKVAAALGNLGGGLLGLAGRFALPAALATTVIKLPWTLANMAGARIGHLREQGEFMGGTAAIGTKFDRMTDQLGARNSRDTSASGQWLTDETNKLRSNLQPINSAFTNAANNTLGWAAKLTNMAVDGAKMAAGVTTDRQGAIAMLAGAGEIGAPGWFGHTEAEEKKIQKKLKEIEAARAAKDDINDTTFAGNLGGWVQAIEFDAQRGPFMQVAAARSNALPKPPARKF